jgi:2-polyprenyl-3-methyl-5-hydroxy-6-metoxy-1,4-benzoquinol methylase
MTETADQPFDAYRTTYRETVEASVGFSGLGYDFFLRSKARLLSAVMAELLEPGVSPRLLDVGCGVGALHPLLAPHCGELHGTDVSVPCIEEARRCNPEARYSAYDGVRLPYADGQFDVALAVCVLHHVPPSDRTTFVAEMARIVRPGGLTCVIEHNPLNPLTRLSVMRCPFDADAVLLPRREAETLMSGAGLSVVRSRYFVLLPSLAPWALSLERRMAQAPLGAQYLTLGRR